MKPGFFFSLGTYYPFRDGREEAANIFRTLYGMAHSMQGRRADSRASSGGVPAARNAAAMRTAGLRIRLCRYEGETTKARMRALWLWNKFAGNQRLYRLALGRTEPSY
jgi:hypothetical protein